MKKLLLLLFVTLSALGQPVIGPEVISTPLASLGDFAVAPQRDGFVIAWEQGGRIYAGHLDATLQLTAPPLELPVTDSRAVASWPAIASDGATVLVAWHELMTSGTSAVAVLTHDAQLLLRGPQQLNAAPKPPFATASNGQYLVYSDELRYGFNDALERVSFDSIPRAMSAAMSMTGDVATASEDPAGKATCFTIGFSCCPDCDETLTFSFRVPSGKILKRTYPLHVKNGATVPLLPPIIGANGDTFAALLRTPTKTDIVAVDDAVSALYSIAEPINTAAAIAGNGSDVVVVWVDGRGVIVHGDRRQPEPFVFSGRIVDDLHLIAAGSSSFVVFYRVSGSLAGRVIQLQRQKQRGIR